MTLLVPLPGIKVRELNPDIKVLQATFPPPCRVLTAAAVAGVLKHPPNRLLPGWTPLPLFHNLEGTQKF